jgi:hypothetical protein
MKKCCRCQELKSFVFFHKNKAFQDGLHHYCKSCRKKYDEKTENKIKKKLYWKNYSDKNKSLLNTKKRQFHVINKEEISLKKKLYYQNNKRKMAEKESVKRKTNIQYRIKSNLSRRIRCFLNGKSKSKVTTAYLGCSLDFFKNYIENLFKDGMSWDNYGLHGWHIDHIRPCASFDLTDPAQQCICFHYSNLQPLWAKDNIKKSSFWKKDL